MNLSDVKKNATPFVFILVMLIILVGTTSRKSIDEPKAKKAKVFSDLPKTYQKETFKKCKPTGLFVEAKKGYSEVKDCNGVKLVKDIVQ